MMKRAINGRQLTKAQHLAASWDAVHEADAADDAQTAYLAALAFADEIRDKARRRAKRLRGAAAAREIAASDVHAVEAVREARYRANHPLVGSKRVTGRDGERVASAANAIFEGNRRRRLRGLQSSTTAYHGEIGSRDFMFNNESDSRIVGLYGPAGLRAAVIVAGAEKKVLVHLIAALQRFSAENAL